MRLHMLVSANGPDPDMPPLEFPPEESPSGWVFPASGAAGYLRYSSGDALAGDHGTAEEQPRDRVLLAAFDDGAAPLGCTGVRIQRAGPRRSALELDESDRSASRGGGGQRPQFRERRKISGPSGAGTRPPSDPARNYQRAGIRTGHPRSVPHHHVVGSAARCRTSTPVWCWWIRPAINCACTRCVFEGDLGHSAGRRYCAPLKEHPRVRQWSCGARSCSTQMPCAISRARDPKPGGRGSSRCAAFP